MAPTPPCSLTDAVLAQRIHQWESIRAAWLGSEATATGAVVEYRLDAAVAHTILELVEAERRCCPSISFEASVTVRIDAPESMRSWVATTFVPEAAATSTTGGEGSLGVDRRAIEESVRAHYAAAARRAALPGADTGCEPAGAGTCANGYEPAELGELPEKALRSSIGCANPVAVADLKAGEIVLDLGSGGGMDVLLTARRVGPTGRAYGLDMTDEMLELARKNQAEAGIDNAEFLAGRIEAIPLPDESVDVVLSNCVIVLSPDKGAVFSESYRVLRPGGRLAIADVVARVEVTPEQRAAPENWVACLAGSQTRSQYLGVLEAAGFIGVSIEERHEMAQGFDSVIVRATKPMA